MRDPFTSNSNSSMLRDAQVGLLLVAILLGLFVYVTINRITGQDHQIPDHVRMAPIATAVWPNGPPTKFQPEFSAIASVGGRCCYASTESQTAARQSGIKSRCAKGPTNGKAKCGHRCSHSH